MTEKDDNRQALNAAKERAHNYEKIAKAMELDLKTIDVLIGNAMADILAYPANHADTSLRAALKICEAMQTITLCY